MFHSPVKFKKISHNEYHVEFKDAGIYIYITGIGIKSIEFIKNVNFDNSDIIIKAGTCAIIDGTINILTPLIPQKILYDNKIIIPDYSKFNKDVFNHIEKYLMPVNLLTIDKPLKSEKEKSEYKNKNINLVDMEVFHLADYFINSNFIPLLAGTDYGSQNAVAEFFLNIKKASILLKDEILSLINIINKTQL